MTNPDNEDGFWRCVEIMNKSHGYGGVFNHGTPEEKVIVEMATAGEWCNSIAAEFGLSVDLPEHNPQDPPDCYVELEGRRVSVELVQLITQEHKWRATNDESPYEGQLFSDMQWSSPRFAEALNKVIKNKGEKYQKREIWIDVLVIHTDEKWLNSRQAREWLEDVEIQNHSAISSVFLLFNYEPGRDVEHWPVFRVYGQLPNSKRRLNLHNGR